MIEGRMDRLQSMRVFQQVVEEGGFAAAARKMDLAPAVVTRLGSDLESHLGVRLLQRTTRRIGLTQAGEAYLERLRGILSGIDEAEAVVQDQASDMRGNLRVLAPPVVAAHILAPAVVAFQELHPGVSVEVHVSDAPDAVHDFDLAVLHNAVQIDPDIVARPFLPSVAVFWASPAYLQRHGEPRTPQDLLHHRVLRLRRPGMRVGPLRLVDPSQGDRVLELDVPAALTANHTDTLLRATLEGGGVSSQPLDLIAPHLREGTLRRLLAPWITARLALLIAVPSRKYMPARTRAFMDHLLDHARRMVQGLGVHITS